jgi:hypothetical protein
MPTYDQYRQQAIDLGALKPQTMGERMADNWASNEGGMRWRDSPAAQARLEQWTEELRAGGTPASAASSSGGAGALICLAVLLFLVMATCH